KGRFKFCFGGPEHFQNAHGICLDTRSPNTPTLFITAREQNRLKRFSLDGKFIEAIDLPGAFINRPVIHGDHVYLSVLKAATYPSAASGFIVILDAENRVVSCPGGSAPEHVQGIGLHQTIRLFQHPHDVCLDADDNLYVPQWNSGGVYPIQLERV
ncbi:MAG: 6-bladed beta-propeller, partial [Bacteroidota bacterium]